MDDRIIEIIRKEIARTDEFARANPLIHRRDPEQKDAVINIALSHPEWGVADIMRHHETTRKQSLRWPVRAFLYRHRILKEDDRIECRDAISRQTANLHQILRSPDLTQVKSSYQGVLAEWRERRLRSPVVARALLLSLSKELAGDPYEALRVTGEQLGAVLRRILLPTSNRLFLDIVRRAAEERGLRDRPTLSDQVTDLIRQVEQIAEESDTDETSPGESSSLAEENADLRAALFGLKHELRRLQDEIQELQQSAHSQVVQAFLADMNSPANGQLLDNLVHSGLAVRRLLDGGWAPELPEVEGVVYSLKMLADYLERLGVKPIQHIGARGQMTMEELNNVTYVGSEFTSKEQVKIVEYRSPGWKYQGQVISRPQAVEIDPGKGAGE